MFRAIVSNNFPPFGNLRMHFPPVENKVPNLAEVHLLTGINGTGKTRLLSLLAAALGQVEPLKKRTKGVDYPIDTYFTTDPSKALNPPQQGGWTGFRMHGGNFATITIGPEHDWLKKVPAFAYSGTAYIADATISVMADIPMPERSACLAFARPETQSAALLQAIANLKIQTAMDLQETFDQPEEAKAKYKPSHATRLVRALENTISEVTARKFIFQTTSYPKIALGVVWDGIKLPFDGLPDGLRAIIGWMAHAIAMMDALLGGKASPLDTEAVFLLDEIEGSLHPAWQRKILPAFQKLFPKAQMFVATHSPFLIASLNHGWIHQLTLESNGKVKAERPRAASEGDSYVTVVEDIMGLKEWYDPETEGLLTEFRQFRDAAYTGDIAAQDAARRLASNIGHRSMELEYMMGREMHQMDRQLAKASAPK